MQWFMMHGYAMYIWPAYGLVLTVLVANLIGNARQYRRIRKIIKNWYQ